MDLAEKFAGCDLDHFIQNYADQKRIFRCVVIKFKNTYTVSLKPGPTLVLK